MKTLWLHAMTPTSAASLKMEFQHLKKDHAYYTQVQGQLALTGAEWCDFVVYTHKGLIIQRIYFESAFWDILYEKLASVYFGLYFKVACEKFHTINASQI